MSELAGKGTRRGRADGGGNTSSSK